MNEEELEMLSNFINLGISESPSEDIYKYGYLEQKITKHIKDLQQENQSLKDKLYKKQDKLNKIIDYVDCPRFSENFENMANENNVRKEIIEILKGDK